MDDDASHDEDVGEDFAQVDLSVSNEAESLLAQDLNQLSFQERDLISDEIHGVRLNYPKETPYLLKSSLASLEIELASLPCTPIKNAYEASLKHSDSYVHKDDFRLIFLRFELFDAKKAALRLIKFLDLIQDAFGPKVLQREIRLADFDKKGKEFLREGYHQVLPGMDRSGRRVTGTFAFRVGSDQPLKNQIKSAIYCMMRCIRDNVNVQRMGLVGLNWTFGSDFENIKRRFLAHRRFWGAIPVRFSAIHCCVPQSKDPIVAFARNMYLMSMEKLFRRRLRIHSGSPTECLYKLQTFGIQVINIPINTNSGKIKTANHHKWLRMQKIQEDAILEKKPFLGIECPEQADVLFGRGWPKMNHPGNAHFRDAIESRLNEYNAANSKKEKTIISWTVVSELRDSGARFLREDESGFWMEVSDEVARQKVSIGFRDIRKAHLKLVATQSKISNSGEHSAPSSKRKNAGHSSEEDTSTAFGFLDDGKRHRSWCGDNSKCT